MEKRGRRKLSSGRSSCKKAKSTRSGKEIEKRLGSPSKASKEQLILMMVNKPEEIFWPSSVLRVVRNMIS
ncbi:hypothetical protein H5410_013324 [Solanum commersonii]|uniref:Uncharacterized protein n=1 Tax=Solanum commersonii TaxID=4109 RepID=A0A9J6AV41_SOLCO|nr:hypothetical protein H5410_013324 [Solanum commersonii]